MSSSALAARCARESFSAVSLDFRDSSWAEELVDLEQSSWRRRFSSRSSRRSEERADLGGRGGDSPRGAAGGRRRGRT